MEYPRCSTALDHSLEQTSLVDDDALYLGIGVEHCEENNNDQDTGDSGGGGIDIISHNDKQLIPTPLFKLKEAIESLKLRPASSSHESDSDYTSLTASSDVSIRFDCDITSRPSNVIEHETFENDNTTDNSCDSNDDEDTFFEPEADIIEQFRQFGLRFIRKPSQYSFCQCKVPQELLQFYYNLSEVACESNPEAMPLCFQMRWAEVKQDFNVEPYGDLQFQDFLLSRQQRGPYHAMVHFGNIFASVGYDGTYWYWILRGNTDSPFIEDKFRNKDNFVNSLRTVVRHHVNAEKGRALTVCPEIRPDAHVFVRSLYDEQCRPTIEADAEEDFDEARSVDDVSLEGPRALSYLQLFSESYYLALATL